ncbi:MAG: dTMP kinase [Candidatus Caldarchaeales archaeon]|nr:dTMP kinase [Candidatus Caldarchaeales archaeon]
MPRSGAVIAIEGIDGAGKTTQAKRVVRRLKSLGYRAAYTSEPTNTRIGRLIKKELSGRITNPHKQALLFAADRIDHVFRVIRPLMEKGFIVVCDRYLYSSFAYQGVLTRDVGWVREINRMAPPPSLAILIDVPVAVALKRKRRFRGFEDAQLLEAVRAAYLTLLEEGLMVSVDGNRDVAEVERDLLSIISSRLGIRV